MEGLEPTINSVWRRYIRRYATSPYQSTLTRIELVTKLHEPSYAPHNGLASAAVCFDMVGAPGFEPGTGGLKVRCDTVSLYSVLVPPDGFEPSPHRVRAEYATNNTSKGWIVLKRSLTSYIQLKSSLMCHPGPIRSHRMTLSFHRTFHVILLCWISTSCSPHNL